MLSVVYLVLSAHIAFLASGANQQAPAAGGRSRAEWAALRDTKFAVPAGKSAFELLREMDALVGSSDPFLRDNVAYEAAARLIYTAAALSAEEQRQILAMWTGNLRGGLGDPAGDAAFKRSFSALNLSVMAAR